MREAAIEEAAETEAAQTEAAQTEPTLLRDIATELDEPAQNSHRTRGAAPTPLSQTGPGTTGKSSNASLIFFLGLLLAGSGLISPPIALVGGIAFGFAVVHPFRREASSLARLLLQISVVFLGFGMDLTEVLHAGRSGFLYTAISISCAITLGLLLGKLLGVSGKASYLITLGTAICGGSAIAAIAPITDASEQEISVSMGTVFLLNSVALLLFPSIGWAMHLRESQFGLWAALAIHDTSSVVGAAARYGPQALAIGTTVKLARALWIVPVSLFTAAYMRRAARQKGPTGHPVASPKFPWFILLFVGASLLSTSLPRFGDAFHSLNHLGKAGLTATLFLIGTSLSRKTLQAVGIRPFLQGVILWIVVATASLLAIHHGLISI